MDVNPNIFRAYDIRGIYPEELNSDNARAIASASTRFLKAKRIIVASDARQSSAELLKAVIEGAISMGVDVINISQATTPLFYFAVNKMKTDGGIMVTASHNAPKYNGLKIVGRRSIAIGAENGLEQIRNLIGNLPESKRKGKITNYNLTDIYIDFLIKSSGIKKVNLKNTRAIIDNGNGMASLVLGKLLSKIGLNYFPIFFEVDNTFPNRLPDTSRNENLTQILSSMVLRKADIGFAFDGDGDRLVVIDSRGVRVPSDYILALLALPKRGLFWKKHSKVVYDLRISKSVKELIGKKGFVSKVGHTYLKAVARKNRVDLGAELSGHFIFKELDYSESAILAMLKVLKTISGSGKKIEELVAPFVKYSNSGEIDVEIRDKDQGTRIIENIKDKYKDKKINELDGITVDDWEAGGWWFNLRHSNTESLMRLVVEAKNQELMNEKIEEVKNLLT